MVLVTRRLVRGRPAPEPAPWAVDHPGQPAALVVEVGHVDDAGVAHMVALPLTVDGALDLIAVLALQARLAAH